MLDDLAKILPVAEIYKDLLQPSTQQAGKALESIVKTARFILAPFDYLGSLQDRYQAFLRRVAEKTAEEELSEVHPKVTGTVLEGIRYLEEDSILFEMFVELLSKALVKKTSSKAHPAFAQIIGQLSPDEALMLTYFKKQKYEFWEQQDLSPITNRFENYRIIRNDFPINDLQFPENYVMYINHLANLQIAGIPEYRNQEPVVLAGRQIGTKSFRRTVFLDFGILFSECCVPDRAEDVNSEKEES